MRFRTRGLWIAVLTFALAAGAAPRPAVDPVAAATAAMAEADFEKALGLLDGALAKAKTPAAVSKIQLMRGQVLVALQLLDQATRAFSAALAADPAAELDPASASPDAVSAMAAARATILSEVTIAIARGEAANVTLDDVELGPAPLKARIGAGKHRLQALAADGRAVSQAIDVQPGKPLAVSLELAAASLPPPAEVKAAAPAAVVRQAPRKRSRSKLGLIPIGLGAAAVGAGIFGLVQAEAAHNLLVNPTGPALDRAAGQRAISDGSTYQAVGFAALGVGAAAVVAGTAMLLFMSSGDGAVAVTAVASPGGVYVGLTGTFKEAR